MKKIIYGLLILIVTFTCFNVYAFRISKFEALFETDEDFQDNTSVLYFGWRGEEAYKMEMDLEIDPSMIEFKQAAAGDTFDIDYKVEHISSTADKYHFVFESNSLNSDIICAGIVFSFKNNFSVGKSSEIKVSDVIAYNDTTKYKSDGYYVELKRTEKNKVFAGRTNINANTNKERLLNKILPWVVMVVVTVFLIIIGIVLIPRRIKEDRRSKIKAQIDPKNYPIPGVGPLPKMKKKEKTDVIEPEEKVIQPLKEFLSKSSDTNEELKNKSLEVDKEMFKDNPTKEGESGLTDINPLAFDDGETEVLDDGRDDDIDTL